jgi:hypothetical protein
MFVVGGFQMIVTAFWLNSLPVRVGGSAILAAGSINKKFEKGAGCPAALT